MSKRALVNDPLWTLTFEESTCLRTMVDSVGSVITNVVFKVVKEEDAHFLSVFGADVGYTCVVEAQVRIDDVKGKTRDQDGKDLTFCLNCKHLSAVLDIPSHSSLPLMIEGHDSEVAVKMYNPDNHTYEASSFLPTFIHEPQEQSMELDVNLNIEMDTVALKEIIKKARKAHSEHITLTVYQQVKGPNTTALIEMSMQGDYKHKLSFCSTCPRGEDGSIVVRASMDCDGKISAHDMGDPIFDGTYPVDKLDAFVKNVAERIVTARVQMGNPNVPIYLRFQLQGEADLMSYVLFLIAPRHDDM